MTGVGPAFDPAEVLGCLTVTEKVALTAGHDAWTVGAVPRLGIPSIRFADGPHGVRRQRQDTGLILGDDVPATCFPTGTSLGSSWDPALVREVGVALGREARARGVHVLLGPGANLKRSPMGGRDFEYFSEDPLLSSTAAAAWVRGVQSTGVAACVKHYALNNQEYRRYTVDVVVDDRALRELYLAAWEPVVRCARPWSVMAAYNKVGGQHCTENPFLLETVLRDEWGFDGLVLSDWGAVTDRVAALAAGLDLEMPGYAGRGNDAVVRATGTGPLSEAALDRAAENVLRLIARTTRQPDDGDRPDEVEHHALAHRAAVAGTVLLRNEQAALPIAPSASVAVVGALAVEPRIQGGGSAAVTPLRVDALLAHLEERLVVPVRYARGWSDDGHAVDAEALAEAVNVVTNADVAIVFVGLPEAAETEGADRTSLRLPAAHDSLVQAVAAVHANVVVVLSSGAPVEMPWADEVQAILQPFLAGQAAGAALGDVLTGVVEPGGRLAETYPLQQQDVVANRLPAGPRLTEYRESVFVGYRYYDALDRRVLFPFGHGLGFTTFRYDNLELSRSEADDGPDLAVEVAVTLVNTGSRAGSEVVQIYVSPPCDVVGRPPLELRGFRKVHLEAGVAQRVTVPLDRRAFCRWSVEAQGWVVDPGAYQVRVGASSRDIRGSGQVLVRSVSTSPPADQVPPDPGALSRDRFAAVLRRALPPDLLPGRAALDADTPLSDLARWPAGRLLLRLGQAGARRLATPGSAEAGSLAGMVADVPLRMLPMFSQGKVTQQGVDGLLALVQGRYLTGLRLLARAARESTNTRPPRLDRSGRWWPQRKRPDGVADRSPRLR